MKTKDKLILIIILFLIFFTFININESFASFDFCYNGENYSLPDFPSTITSQKNIFIFALDGSSGPTFYLSGTNYDTFYSSSLRGYVCWCSPPKYSMWDNANSYTSNGFSVLNHLNTGKTLVYTNNDILDNTGTIIFKAGFQENQSDKINLFELNLTDLDYKNQIHKFNLSTYTDSECYDEIMELYNNNNQYAIYVTDYQRILTYGEENNDDSFQYGSYILSGYIDFLITDKAYFYYSPYYNKVLSNSGTSFFDKNTADYTKRFYFKYTYSEDSNDPNCEIWADNGNLLYTENLINPDYYYFIGSSHTIYRAIENNKNQFTGLSDSIYYLGYLGTGKTRDISEVPFYVYNFSFGGGTTQLLFSNSSTYMEDINNIYSNIHDNYNNNNEIPKDSSEGMSYKQGTDFTSSTFNDGEVTDNTTTEEDTSHIGNIDTPSTGGEEDETNWTIFDYVKNIFKKIIDIPKNILEGLINLFIPTDSQWEYIKQSYIELGDLVSSKLPFVSEFKTSLEEAQNDVFASNDFLNITMPSFSFMGGETREQQIFNVRDAYEPYRVKIRSLLALVVYGCGFVYILKTVLNYNATASGITQSNIFNDMKKGGE